MKFLSMSLILALLTTLLPTSQPALAQENAGALAALGLAQRDRCFNLQAADATAVLGTEVNPTWSVSENADQDYCVFASTAASNAVADAELLPTYGPLTEHYYLAATVWPVGQATDPIMYLAYALLDRDHSRLNEFTSQFGLTNLAELAKAPSQRPQLTRQFLPQVGEGAIWYWQELTSGQHLAGIYALAQERRVAVQSLVAPDQTEASVRAALTQLVETLIATAPPFQVQPTLTPTPQPTVTPRPRPTVTATPSAREKAAARAWQQYAQKIYLQIGESPRITLPADPGAMAAADAQQVVEQAWTAVLTPTQPYRAVMMGVFMGMPMLLGETAALSAERVHTKAWNTSTGDRTECIEYDGELFIKRKNEWSAAGDAALEAGDLTLCQQFFAWGYIDPFGPIVSEGVATPIEARITVTALGKGVYRRQAVDGYQVERVAADTGQAISKIEFYLDAETGLPLIINYIPTLEAPFPLGVVTRIEYPNSVVVKKPAP